MLVGELPLGWDRRRSVSIHAPTPRKAAEVQCRFHDLRHTCITRLLEAGVSLSVVASLMGWSPATTTRMAKRYAHFGDSVRRRAMETLDPPTLPLSKRSDEQETIQ